jgi:hypothetical protein
MEFVVRAIRMTLSLCHSVAEEHDLIVDVESRPERRRQQYIRALLVMAVETSIERMDDLRPSGAAAATHRMVIHLNAEVPADDLILRFVEGAAAPVRRAELLRHLLVQARRLYTPSAAPALRASASPASHKPPRPNAERGVREPAVNGKTTWVCSTEIDVVLPDDEETSRPTLMPDATAVTHRRSIGSDPALAAEPASVEPQRPAAMPAITSDEDVQQELSALKGLFE